MITIATLLWDANSNSESFSRCYDESWVDKLYRGFARNLTMPFQFVCFTDRTRTFGEPIAQERLSSPAKLPTYASCIEPFRLGVPMILVGLDTVIMRNIDHLAHWCLDQRNAGDHLFAVPRDPFAIYQSCNGVCLVPAGLEDIYRKHNGENDMEWLHSRSHVFIDDIFPGSVVSYKGHVLGQTPTAMYGLPPEPKGFAGVDICYLHGNPKQHQLGDVPEIMENWK